jgi:hypothetical protein
MERLSNPGRGTDSLSRGAVVTQYTHKQPAMYAKEHTRFFCCGLTVDANSNNHRCPQEIA